jgi:hypothetical protein
MNAASTRVVFVDTVAWIALFNSRDDLHAAAIERPKELYRHKIPLITTEFVLIEFADAFAAPPLRTSAVAVLSGLRQEPLLEILPATAALFEDGLTLYAARPDEAWSLTDCISLAVMQERGVTTAFSADHHFAQAGHQLLL